MTRFCILFCLLGLALGSAPHAVTQDTANQQREARLEAHTGDCDYLLGDWQFTAKSKQYGTFTGVWSAVRLPQGQILDEYRVLGDDGQTIYVTTTCSSRCACTCWGPCSTSLSSRSSSTASRSWR